MNIHFLRSVTPRWVIFAIDLSICLFSIVFAYYLRFNFEIPQANVEVLSIIIPLVLFVRAVSFAISKTYIGLVRYTSTKDVQRLFVVLLIGSAFLILLNIVAFQIIETYIVPTSVVIIDFFITVLGMIFFRLVIKNIFFEFQNPRKERSNVVILGTDETSLTTKRTIERDVESKNNVIGFIDYDEDVIGNKIEDIKVYGIDDLENLIARHSIETLIIANKKIPVQYKQQVIDICLDNGVKTLTIPDVTHWINGELTFRQIKEIKIEDLLERNPIQLDKKQINNQLTNKTILITGAAGSIGSEIMRQITGFKPKMIVLFDQAESPMYDLELEMCEQLNFTRYKTIIGDVTNKKQVEHMFESYHPDYVYHAAAYKHVPMMEHNPSEAVRTNVFGTQLVADAAVKYAVKKFVMVSTDKAVNPTNVMGASKRIAEIYTQSLNTQQTHTRFITTRFGNVLGSNGSVIPRFQKQIENGGPITITHPEVTRYFMTISEACQLVLEAGSMGKGGEIFIFDMGKSIKIINLAKRMVKLSGMELGKDIQMTFIGLRPGEKLYEELLATKENTSPTYHEQIMIAKVRTYDFEYINNEINSLTKIPFHASDLDIVKKMKSIVPEFRSQNSIYESLDTNGE
ncbi:MAG: nucleoside-diphosphate sugar epimerase/dehydratase [Bacteroidota bacterium]|nr:nucleoside-diphosphate sugar epimerase/dehydratase [Bacteroidota bacterium]